MKWQKTSFSDASARGATASVTTVGVGAANTEEKRAKEATSDAYSCIVVVVVVLDK